jgi:hypothetical protein
MDDLFSPMLSAGRMTVLTDAVLGTDSLSSPRLPAGWNVLVRGVRAPFDASMKDFGRKDVRPDFA